MTAANVTEAMRILTRARAHHGTKLTLSAAWDQFRSAFLIIRGAGVENVVEALQLLTDAKTVRVLMAQTRQPFTDRNGRPKEDARDPWRKWA